jgi:hypothetical protein
LGASLANNTAANLFAAGDLVVMPLVVKTAIRESAMKKLLSLSSLFLFACSSMCFAAANQSGSVHFSTPVRVGTNNLPAGTYAIHWQAGSGDEQVKISGNGLDIAVPATVAPSAVKAEVLTRREGSTDVVEGFTVKATSFTIKQP